ncbi:hypothetical protein BDV06DRAFT_114511 [Aspergillus oleicola]
MTSSLIITSLYTKLDQMMSLYSFVDQVADIIMSVFTQRSTKRTYYEDDDDKPLAYRRDQVKAQRSQAVRATENQGRGPNSNYIYPYDQNYNPVDCDTDFVDTNTEQYFRRSQRHKNVHWGSIEEIPEGSIPSSPGLSQYHQRRKRGKKSNYVYGAGSPSGSPSPGSSRSGSPTDSTGSNDSYDGQRYPPGWYGRFSRGSRSPSPKHLRPTSGTDQYTYPRPPLHHTHIPRKSILKPPTPKDDEMLIRNLWTMGALAEQRLDYMYEFLSGVLNTGDDVLDSMLRAGELSMIEEATRHARRMSERQKQNYQAEYRPTKTPVPQKQYSPARSVPRHTRSSPSGSRMDTLEEYGEEG